MTRPEYELSYHCSDCRNRWTTSAGVIRDDECPRCGIVSRPTHWKQTADWETAWRLVDNPPRSELTPAGEQLVIPGCERNLAPAKTQLDLFG